MLVPFIIVLILCTSSKEGGELFHPPPQEFRKIAVAGVRDALRNLPGRQIGAPLIRGSRQSQAPAEHPTSTETTESTESIQKHRTYEVCSCLYGVLMLNEHSECAICLFFPLLWCLLQQLEEWARYSDSIHIIHLSSNQAYHPPHTWILQLLPAHQ